jgi:sporulation protein YlmC with PRC-barrel domain
MLDIDTVLGWRGKTVRDREGEKVGTLGDLYLDRETDRPAYAGVRTGLFRQRESVVPLSDAEEVDGDVRVPYTAAQIREAPNVDPEIALDADEEARLDDHYGAGGGATVGAVAADRAEPETRRDESGDDGVEVVRSEEEVEIGTGPAVPRERVRLKKYVVTDMVEKTVPVRREEVRVEHDPPESGRIVDVEDV